MKAILDQSILTIIGGLGTIFVMAQGGTDLSVGGTVGVSSILGGLLASKLGSEIFVIPVVLLVGVMIGVLCGIVVVKFRVSSFMTTIAMMISLRGLFVYLFNIDSYHAGPIVRSLYNYYVEVPVLLVLIAISHYFLEYTKMGKYSKAIGENEAVAINIGIPVKKVKIIAFIASGAMASVTGLFMMAKLGGVVNTMGTSYEMDILIAVFLGGALVSGGNSTRVSKLLVGAFTLSILKNGLVLIGLTTTASNEAIRGVALLIFLFITLRFNEKYITLGQKS